MMDKKRLAEEGAFILADQAVAPPLVCGACRGSNLAGTITSVAGGVAVTRVLCQDCGRSYYLAGQVKEEEDVE